MKKILFTLALTFIGLQTTIAQVGIGTETPESSAQLELQSTNKGFLPPRMTTHNRNNIENPVEGLTIYNTDDDCLNIYVGFGWRNLCAEVGPNDVINPKTGQIWMDRNLGASQVATSPTDAKAYGDLYQWGRASDGHEKRTSPTHDGATNRPSTITETGAWDGKFITIPNDTNRNDWVTTQTDNAWNTGTADTPIKTATDPCPSGYRIPTQAEWNAERLSWNSNDSAGAFASPLKLPVAGFRRRTIGSLSTVGTFGIYWSSSVSGSSVRYLSFSSSFAKMDTFVRAHAFSVRCIKD